MTVFGLAGSEVEGGEGAQERAFPWGVGWEAWLGAGSGQECPRSILLEAVAGAVGFWGFFEDAGEFSGEVGLVGKAAVVGDFGEGLGGADDEVGGFLDAEVAKVGLGGHAEGGFEFTEEAGEGEVGGFGELGDGDIIAEFAVEELEGGAEFVVFGEGGGALVEGAGDADDAANFPVLVEEGLFGGGGPVDEAAAAWDEFDAVNDGISGFDDAEVIVADVL
jgi:hypothetical protein